MKGKNSWEKLCKEIQERSLNQTLLEVENAVKFKRKIFDCLNDARNERILSTNLKEIHKLLKIICIAECSMNQIEKRMEGSWR